MADVTASMLPTRPDGRPLRGRILTGYLRFVARLEELGATLIEPHWLGTMTPHRVRCAANHDCSPRPNNVVSGQSVCRVCVGRDPATAEAEFRARLDGLGVTLLEPRWLGTETPHRVRCAAGHHLTTRPHTAMRVEDVCGICAGRDPSTVEARFRARIKELGGVVIGEYVTSLTPVEARCAVGHACNPRPSSVLSGRGMCWLCSGRHPSEAEVYFRARIEELGGVVLGKYVNSKTKVEVRCAEGHECSTPPNSVLSGAGFCLTCAGVTWDVFYVVTGPAGVKFGITSGDPRPRLRVHRSNGYGRVVRLHEGLPGTTARDLERELLGLLRVSGVEPIRGREYFPAAALPTILYVVDDWLGDTGGELIVDDAA